jgi:porin
VFGQRRGDTFGIGWYHVGASNKFGPVPQAKFGPGDGNGVELFYNFQVTPCLTITPDLQVIEPGGTRTLSDTALIGGVRVNLKL